MRRGHAIPRRSVIAFAALLAAGCRGAQVDVRNRSSETLQGVVISANGASTTIGRIAAGDTRQRFLCPRGEAGSVDVSFQANGQIHRQRRPVYFECDFLYRVRVDVSPEFEVVVDTSLR
jgi:hypothetical protein